MEYWDIYDINRNKTGKLIKRGDTLKKGEYHLFVQVWIMNKEGKFLSQERSENVRWPHMWCANGGNAIAGEDSYTCALREIKEELGLDLNEYQGGLFDQRIYEEDGQSYFCDSFLYYIDLDITKVNFQKEEIARIEYKDMDEIIEMMNRKDYFVYDEDYLNTLREYANKKRQ